MEDALRVASSPHDFKLLVAAEGRTSTSMEDLVDSGGRDTGAGPVTLKRPGSPGPLTGVGGPQSPASPTGPGRQRSSAPPPRPGVAA